MKLQIDTATLTTIPLRYYKGWTIEFNVQLENFQSPLLCLFNFTNVKDLEKAMDNSLKLRGHVEKHSVKVQFENGNSILSTINGTKQEIEKYYLGNTFNVGIGGNDEMSKAVSLIFLD